jgi:hypothetical protein
MQSILGQAAARTGMSYSLYEQEEDFMLVESAIPVAADTVAVTISFFNRNLLLRTSPTGGWMEIVEQQDAEALTATKPLWEAPLMALGILCAVALGAAMLAMLVQKHLHQTLLQVSDLFGANRNDSGFSRGDREKPLNDGQRPEFRGVRVALGTGYNRVRGIGRGGHETARVGTARLWWVCSLPTLTRFAGAVQSMLPLKTLPFVERGRNFCERFDTVTILFSDIVSFTNLAATMDPLRVVNMLNELYRMYDGLVDKHHVYKVRRAWEATRVVVGERGAEAVFSSL